MVIITSRKKIKSNTCGQPQPRKSITFLLGLIIVSTFLIGILLTLRNPKTLPFRQIRIDAPGVYLKVPELKNVIIQNIRGGFFSLNTHKLQSALMVLPWVSNVSIRRMWPDKLEITIAEQQPLARWNETQLISKLGILFTPPIATIPKDLPQLQGLNNNEKVVFARFKQFNQLLKPLRIKITALRVSDRKAWFLVLNNHIQVYLGHEDIDQRFKKLVQFYQKIIGNRGDRVDHIDLRYPNGLAIQWRTRFLINAYEEEK